MSAIRLTVGIPTYNRAEDLCLALETVLAQVDDRVRDQMEIVISDNASSDQTQQVVNEYTERYPDLIFYRRNPSNLGFSRNVDAVVRHARGEFVLLLSDDDGLDDNAIKTVWGILDEHKDLGVVLLSETPYDSDLRFPLSTTSGLVARKGGMFYSPGLEYVKRTRIFPPFLVSGYVVRREAWLQSCLNDFTETICVHILTVLPMLLDHSAYVSYSSSIRYRTENKGGNRWLDELHPFTLYLNLLIGCRAIKGLYPFRLHRYLHQQAMRSIAYHIMDEKVSGVPLPVSLLLHRMNLLADPKDPLLWLNRILLYIPAWMIRIPFKISIKLRAIMKKGLT